MNDILDFKSFKDYHKNFTSIFNKKNKEIVVGKPTLPNLNEFIPHLENIWNNKIVSNNGPYVKKFEKKLEEYLGVKSVISFSNATTALISLLHCLT